MARLIDADAFLEEARNRIDMQDMYLPIHIKYFVIDEVSTIDAEPIVRCKDCKYFQCNMRQDGSLPFGVDEYECRHWCGYCDPMDFCSYGERGEDEWVGSQKGEGK